MTVRHLKVFIAVADCGKMSLAAKQLYIAQPTVSQIIAEMEQYYHTRLFERLSKKLYITDAGRQLLQYARHIVALFDEMELQLQYAAAHVSLKVGASITIGSRCLTPILSRFEREFPAIRAHAYIDNTHVIEDMILESKLDVALVEGIVKSGELVIEPVAQDELILVCGQGHPFWGKACVSIQELAGQPFILREKGSGTREIFERFLQGNSVGIEEKWVCHSTDAILSAVCGGQGISVLSRLLVGEAAREKKLHILKLQDVKLSRTFHLIYHKNKFLSNTCQAFIRFAHEAPEWDITPFSG